MREEYTLEELQKRIKYQFHNTALLKQALTHSSYANEKKIYKEKDYERLEFLGDAVLELVSSTFLFENFPEIPEGKLTKKRASLVCEPALAYCARTIELGEFIFLGRGEELGGGRNRDSIISDVVEACIGAMYLDGGFAKAKEFILWFVLSDIEKRELFMDSKSILQEMVQAESKEPLHYELVDEDGPDHDKVFKVEAWVGKRKLGAGTGHTKKAAEQQAAYQAVLYLKK
ncbi:MAG: ribonuclease III [Lachnospiraceae bacterium]|nr:ribonuclease III [Lachnospiraceae bacterium]